MVSKFVTILSQFGVVLISMSFVLFIGLSAYTYIGDKHKYIDVDAIMHQQNGHRVGAEATTNYYCNAIFMTPVKARV